ncbi:MAG: asparaginase [Verrucomicrobia bacterium]|nr:asparaginase [Verrucomicrobiota bacterium]
MSDRNSPALVEVWRGDLVESRHRVHLAVVRSDGVLIASAGDPDLVTFIRSTAKPFQAQPFAAVLADYGLDSRHLALACASHAGEEIHVATAREILDAAGLSPSLLRCGVHPPNSAAARERLRARGEAPSVLHNNCSGKHAGMLAAAKARGWPLENYHEPTHPLQCEIAALLQTAAGGAQPHLAIDGCSVPTFALSLRDAALAYARLAQPDANGSKSGVGLEATFRTMAQHPRLLGGETAFDTRLLEMLGPDADVVSKFGAEMFHALALRQSRWGALGVALKIEDGGQATRARDAAVIRVLDRLGIAAENELLRQLAPPELRNAAGIVVGEVRAAFELTFV